MDRRQDLLIFEVTQQCNLDCSHCYNVWKGSGAPYPRGQLSTEQTLALLDRVLGETGAGRVTLTGGEPLLRDDLPQLIAFLHGRGVAEDIISNGVLLTDEAIASLPAEKVGLFELPLLSSEEAIFDGMVGQAGAFSRVTEAMAQLKLMACRVVGVFVATRQNLGTLEQTLEMALALGLDGVMFNRFNPGGRGLENLDLQASPAQLRQALELADDFSRRHMLPVSCSIPMPGCLFDHTRYPALGFGHCAAGGEHAYYTVDPLGNLRPCNHSPTILGNLLEQDFWQLARGPAMRRFMEARPDFCAGCSQETTCQGGCKAAAEAGCGDPIGLDPFVEANREEANRGRRARAKQRG